MLRLCVRIQGICAPCVLQTEMRTFFRRYFTHNRYISATATPLEALQLNQGLAGASSSGAVDLSSLYIDMRPYMNRSPFTVRRDCSASRVHQVGDVCPAFPLRLLVVVDSVSAAES